MAQRSLPINITSPIRAWKTLASAKIASHATPAIGTEIASAIVT